MVDIGTCDGQKEKGPAGSRAPNLLEARKVRSANHGRIVLALKMIDRVIGLIKHQHFMPMLAKLRADDMAKVRRGFEK